MKTQFKEIYRCDHCNKLYQIKKYAELHEIVCNKNPDNFRKCWECKHLKNDRAKFYYDTWEGESHRTVNVFKCTKLECYLFPPIREHKGEWYEFGDIENIPMKRECEQFEDKWGELSTHF